MANREMDVRAIVDVLRATPNQLAELARAASPAVLRAAPAPGEWSAAEVLAHLRACADTWGSAIERIVAESHPTLQAVNPTTWIESTDYRELAFGPSLRSFARQRDRLLTLLGNLPTRGWSRSATVTGAGRPLERTVRDYADKLARHEQTHVKQIERTIRAVLEA